MPRIGHPFMGEIYYEVEASYGAGFSSATLHASPISDFIQDVRIGSGDRHAKIMGFDSPLVKELLEQCKEPTLHIEYHLQYGDTFFDKCVDRTGSCCTLPSFAIEVGANTCTGLPAAAQSWYYFKGCKAGVVKIASSKNNPYSITVDLEAKSVVTASTSAGTAPSDLGTPLCAFNVAGTIRNGVGANMAYFVNSIDLNFNHNLSPYTDHDALEKELLVEGELAASGSIDITLDEGGKVHMGQVLSNEAFAICVKTGSAAAGGGQTFVQIDLPACEWDNSEIDQNVSGEAMIESAPFTSVPSSCSNIVSNPTV